MTRTFVVSVVLSVTQEFLLAVAKVKTTRGRVLTRTSKLVSNLMCVTKISWRPPSKNRKPRTVKYSRKKYSSFTISLIKLGTTTPLAVV